MYERDCKKQELEAFATQKMGERLSEEDGKYFAVDDRCTVEGCNYHCEFYLNISGGRMVSIEKTESGSCQFES